MNYKMLKDKKVVCGTTLFIVFSALAIILAVYGNSYWVFFSILSMYTLQRSLHKTDKIMKN